MELLFAISVHRRDDMEAAESFITRQVSSNHSQRCSFLRSMEYVKIRLHALYGKPISHILTAYCGGLKIVLTPERRLEIWTCYPVSDAEELLPACGKRRVDHSGP